MTALNPLRLGGALLAGARGTHPLEAGTSLLIDCGSWLHRGDFTSRFITAGTSISDGCSLLASIDWEAAVTALHVGELPASGGERRVLLLAASIAGGTPVSLCDTLPGIDRRNAGLVVSAVAHAAGLADPGRSSLCAGGRKIVVPPGYASAASAGVVSPRKGSAHDEPDDRQPR
jgi:hypothetical protein